MHFGLALQLGNAFQECLAIDADGAAQRIISIKDRAKAERQYSGALKAFADHMCVLEQGFLTKIAGRNVFTYQDGKIAAGVREYLGVCNTFKTFYGDGTTSANTTLDSLLLNDAVRVPCHEGASPVGKTFSGPA